jgi:hypothetical protein
MSGPISIHNVPPQMNLPGRSPNDKGKGRRRPADQQTDPASDPGVAETEQTNTAADGAPAPDAGRIGTHIDIEA